MVCRNMDVCELDFNNSNVRNKYRFVKMGSCFLLDRRFNNSIFIKPAQRVLHQDVVTHYLTPVIESSVILYLAQNELLRILGTNSFFTRLQPIPNFRNRYKGKGLMA